MMLNFCCACGSDDNLHHHHLIPRSLGGGDSAKNLITLCGACHSLFHDLGDAWSRHQMLTLNGLSKRKANGLVVGSIPHGYRRVGDNIVQDENEQITVALVRELRGQGMTLRAIGDELTRRGAFNRAGRPFRAESVRAMLRNH